MDKLQYKHIFPCRGTNGECTSIYVDNDDKYVTICTDYDADDNFVSYTKEEAIKFRDRLNDCINKLA